MEIEITFVTVYVDFGGSFETNPVDSVLKGTEDGSWEMT